MSVISGQDVIDVLHALKRRGADTEKLAEVYGLIRQNGNIGDKEAEKIAKILSGTLRNERTLSAEVRELVMQQDGIFNASDFYKILHFTTVNDRKNLYIILRRMSEESPPVIEKYGKKSGAWRRILDTEEAMDMTNVDMTEVPVELPLSMHEKTKIFRGSILVVAGVTGMGKTAYALNTIWLNQGKMPIWYLNTELNKQALKYLVEGFRGSSWGDWDFTPIKVMDSFARSVRPDDLNIIDYLEAPEGEFWRITEPMRAIERKLRKGVALILLQRNSNAAYGDGGEKSAHAASFYMNMSWGVVEVVKNRFRQADLHRGLDKRTFDIREGLIAATSGWMTRDGAWNKRDRKKASSGEEEFVHESE